MHIPIITYKCLQALILESKNYHSENNQYFSHNQKGILKFISYFLVLFLIFILWSANRILFIRQIMNLESQWLWTHYIAKCHFWTIMFYFNYLEELFWIFTLSKKYLNFASRIKINFIKGYWLNLINVVIIQKAFWRISDRKLIKFESDSV